MYYTSPELHIYDDSLVLPAVFHRVRKQIGNDLLYTLLVSGDVNAFRAGKLDIIPLLHLEHMIRSDELIECVSKIERHNIYLHRASLHTRQFEHICDKCVQPFRLFYYDLKMFFTFFRIVSRQVAYHFGIRLYHSQRCPQIVRDVCHEILLKDRRFLKFI